MKSSKESLRQDQIPHIFIKKVQMWSCRENETLLYAWGQYKNHSPNVQLNFVTWDHETRDGLICTSWCFTKSTQMHNHMKLNEDRSLGTRVRKVYRPETFADTILFLSLKYPFTADILKFSDLGYRWNSWHRGDQCLWPDEYQPISLRWFLSVSVLGIVSICARSQNTIVSQFRTIAYAIQQHICYASPPMIAASNFHKSFICYSTRQYYRILSVKRPGHLLLAPPQQAHTAIIAAVCSRDRWTLLDRQNMPGCIIFNFNVLLNQLTEENCNTDRNFYGDVIQAWSLIL